MRMLLVLILLAGCQAPSPNAPSSLNHAPGKYRDYADYMIHKDSSIGEYARARGASPEQTHCAIETYAVGIWGSDYERLSDAVSGKRTMTLEEERWAESRLKTSDADTKESMERAWAKCLA